MAGIPFRARKFRALMLSAALTQNRFDKLT